MLKKVLKKGGIAFILLALAGNIYYFAYQQASYQCIAVREELEILQKKFALLLEEEARFRHISALKEKSCAAVQEELRNAEADFIAVRDKLALYEKVMQPGKNKQILKIQKLKIFKIGKQYHYKISIMQTRKRRKYISGTVQFLLKGERAGQFSRLVIKDSKELAFRFKFLQILEGSFVLPNDFMVKELTIEAISETKKIAKFVQVLVWQGENIEVEFGQ